MSPAGKKTLADNNQASAAAMEEHLAKVLDYEEAREDGRHMKRRRTDDAPVVEVAQTVALKGRVTMGIFWPKDIYKKRFDKDVPKCDLQYRDHGSGLLQGCILPSTTPALPGCIELYSEAAHQVATKRNLDIDPDKVKSVFDKLSGNLVVKPKLVDSTGNGGDESNQVEQAHTRKCVAKLDDDMGSDDDPLD